jgi:short-subunit dehydrogenase
MQNIDENPKTVLITGASSGIGLAFAREFAEQGFDVVLVARRENKLNEIATEIKAQHGAMATVIVGDLADPSTPQAIFDTIKQKDITIDVLVNSAGYSIDEKFLDTSWETHANYIQVLSTSLAHMCHLFAPGMKERNYGRIINISSIAAFSPQLSGSLYGAAKSFVLDFTQAIDLELKPHNVFCTALCPGFTYSEFHDAMGVREAVNKLPKLLWMDAQTVAKEGIRAVMEGKTVHINGLLNQGVSHVLSILPVRVKQFISEKQSIFEL